MAGVHWFGWAVSERSAHTGLQDSHLFGCSHCRGSSASSQPRSRAVLMLWRSWSSTSSTREAAEGFHVHLLAGWELKDFMCISWLGDSPVLGVPALTQQCLFQEENPWREKINVDPSLASLEALHDYRCSFNLL